MTLGLNALFVMVNAVFWPAFVQRPAITVQGKSECPTPGEVDAILSGMLASVAREDLDAAPETVSIDPAGPDVMITVGDQDGAIRLTRRLARPGEHASACPALAKAAAVVIATWRMERNASLSLLQPGVAPPLETPAPRIPVWQPLAVRAAAPADDPAVTSTLVYLAAGIGMSVNQGGVAGTAEVELDVRPRTQRLGLALALAADTARDQALEGRTSAWRRLSAGIGLYVSLMERPIGIEARGQVLLGRTSVEGRGYDSDRTDHAVSPGLEAAVRLVLTGRLQPFLEAGIRGWLAPQDIVVVRPDQTEARVSLPRAEGRLTAGLRFSFGT